MNPFWPRMVSYTSATVALMVHAMHSTQTPEARISLFFLAAFCAWVALTDAVKTYQKRPKRFAPKSAEINDYLCSWLGSGGLSAVFSRDLSWANGGDARRILQSKAKEGSLIACVGRETPEIKELASLGGEVHNYSDHDFSPASRFTVIDYGKASPRIAIGITEDGKHVIREYDYKDRVIMALAEDLMELARKSSRRMT